MNTSFSDLADLLTELSGVQDELLAALGEKRRLLVAGDAQGLQAIGEQEEQLVGRLQDCHDRRTRLLQRAAEEGMPSDSLRSLTSALPQPHRHAIGRQVDQAAARSRLLQHHSLANWVLAQRTLIHLSQMLEMIATGGRPRPTYGQGEPIRAGGSLMDREV